MMSASSSSSTANGAAIAGPSFAGKVPIAPLGQPPVRPNDRPIRSYRRSRSGCFTCRLRRKKCDEARPNCATCTKLGLKCEYKIPHWWSTGESRRRQKNRIKDRIRQTKVMEKHGSLREYMDRIRALTERAPKCSDQDSNRPMMGEQYNWNAPILPPITPCNINVTSETYVSPGIPASFPVGGSSSISFTPVNAPQGPMTSHFSSQLPSPMSAQAPPSQEPAQMTPQMSTQSPTDMPMHGLPMPVQLSAETSPQPQMVTEMATPAPVEMSAQMPTQESEYEKMASLRLKSPSPTEIAGQLPIQLQTQVRTQMPIIMPVQVPSPRLPTDSWFPNNSHSLNQSISINHNMDQSMDNQSMFDHSQSMAIANQDMVNNNQGMFDNQNMVSGNQDMFNNNDQSVFSNSQDMVNTNHSMVNNNLSLVNANQSLVNTNQGIFNTNNGMSFHNNFGQLQHYPAMDVPGFAYPNGALPVPLKTIISLDENDSPFLDHFIDNVLRLAFPIVELHQVGQFRLKEIFSVMRYNRAFLHCCLSVSASHMKTSLGLDDQMDHDIMKHRYEAISQLCRVLARGHNPIQVIDATLGMIYYHCKISNSDDYLPDIPWTAHFQGVATLVKKLQHSPSQFNISLITWIDILGSTMKGATPHFAHAYRTKHLKGALSGLRGLMGCDDRVMYLISEITCLESLRLDGEVSDEDICGHVTALSHQIDWTEPEDRTLQHPYTSTGAVMPMPLTKSITALFRIAARIYLNSLLPDFNRFDFSITNMVSSFAEKLAYIPGGLNGYDRCLVWPLFIVGAYSTPACTFRRVLTDRIADLGYLGDFASFGRMYRVLRAIWRDAEGPIIEAADDEEEDAPGSPESIDSDATIRPPLHQLQDPESKYVHWREIMKRNNWDFLLM